MFLTYFLQVLVHIGAEHMPGILLLGVVIVLHRFDHMYKPYLLVFWAELRESVCTGGWEGAL